MSTRTPLARALTAMLGSGDTRCVELAARIITDALAASGGNFTHAAADLGVSRETLYECRARSREVRRALAATRGE